MNFRLLLSALLVVSAALEAAAQANQIIPAARRTAALADGREILQPRGTGREEQIAGSRSPFTLETLRATTGAPAATDRLRGLSPREVLAAAAEKITPTGKLMLGQRRFLVLGDRQVAPGGTLDVDLWGTPVRITLVAVEASGYTLGYRDERLERPLK